MKKIAYVLCSGIVTLLLTNCNNGNAELEKEKLALEKAKLELEGFKNIEIPALKDEFIV